MTERQAVLMRILINTGGIVVRSGPAYRVAAVEFDMATVQTCLHQRWLTHQNRDGVPGFVTTKTGRAEL